MFMSAEVVGFFLDLRRLLLFFRVEMSTWVAVWSLLLLN